MTDSAQGEDRSSFQDTGPWTADSFGIAKATEGLTLADATFVANWRTMREEGCIRGAYHFFHPALSALEQAEFFLATVRRQGLEPGDLLVLDAEIATGSDGAEALGTHSARRTQLGAMRRDTGCRHTPVSPRTSDGATSWCQTCSMYCGGTNGSGQAILCARDAADLSASPLLTVGEGAAAFLGYLALECPRNPVVLYSFLSFLPQLSLCTGFPLWLAFPSATGPGSVSPWNRWTLWQWAFGGGQGGGDRDAFNGDLDAMRAWIASYTDPPEPAPAPATDWETKLMSALPTLREGDQDSEHDRSVLRVQALASALGGGPVTLDGVFGPQTAAAVKRIQADFGITQDGVVTPQTWGALVAGTASL